MPNQAGFMLSFDDDYLAEWYALRPLLDRHKVRATFFLTRPHRLSTEAKTQIRTLAAEGHEIGAHGYEHLPVGFHYGADPGRAGEYEHEEVLPALAALRDIGLDPRSYSFPRGEHGPAFDEVVLRHFKTIRITGRKRRFMPVQFNPALYRKPGAASRIQGALGLDERYGLLPKQYQAVLSMAQRTGWIACFYAHKPGYDDPRHTDISDPESYRISPERIDWLCTAARELKLRDYLFGSLP